MEDLIITKVYGELNILKDFNYISLEDMSEVKLLNRVDTKFVFNYSQLDQLLLLLKDDYDVLNIKGETAIAYESLYFDTDALSAYSEHHRGKGERFKIRFRNYVSSKLCFLEIKKKHKGRTIKNRIKVKGFENKLSEDALKFIQSHIDITGLNLKPILQIDYKRITLVNKDRSERITLDIDLTYKNKGEEKNLKEIVIAELKQQKISRMSKFYQTVKKLHIRNIRISKYCIGIILMYEKVKFNGFKEKLLYVDKLTNGNIFRSIAA